MLVEIVEARAILPGGGEQAPGGWGEAGSVTPVSGDERKEGRAGVGDDGVGGVGGEGAPEALVVHDADGTLRAGWADGAGWACGSGQAGGSGWSLRTCGADWAGRANGAGTRAGQGNVELGRMAGEVVFLGVKLKGGGAGGEALRARPKLVAGVVIQAWT